MGEVIRLPGLCPTLAAAASAPPKRARWATSAARQAFREGMERAIAGEAPGLHEAVERGYVLAVGLLRQRPVEWQPVTPRRERRLRRRLF